MVDGVPEHLCCEGLINLTIFSHGQADAAEAEDGEVGVVQFSVEHGCSLLVLWLRVYGGKNENPPISL